MSTLGRFLMRCPESGCEPQTAIDVFADVFMGGVLLVAFLILFFNCAQWSPGASDLVQEYHKGATVIPVADQIKEEQAVPMAEVI